MTERNEDIIKRYNDGESTASIAGIYDISDRQVRNVLTENGVQLTRRTKYDVNEEFFRSWSSDMAYVLGLTLTDGTMTLAQKDRHILEQVNDVMSSTYPIRYRDNVHKLAISRKAIVEGLAALGITERKSFTTEMPDVPPEYLADFLRGVIDGDGWVQDRGYVMNITTASKVFAGQLLGEFERRGLNSRITQQGRAYRVWVSGKYDVLALADWIYGTDSKIYLERKRKRFYVNKKTLAS